MPLGTMYHFYACKMGANIPYLRIHTQQYYNIIDLSCQEQVILRAKFYVLHKKFFDLQENLCIFYIILTKFYCFASIYGSSFEANSSILII
jgi:hypothetical protein